MATDCEDLERRVANLERQLRVIREELKRTSAVMLKTIEAANEFRDRVFAAMEKAMLKPRSH